LIRSCRSTDITARIFKYDIDSLSRATIENSDFTFTFLDALLDKTTALLAAEHDAVCIFVNDICDEAVLQKLSELSVVRKVYCNRRCFHFFSLIAVIIDFLEICRTSMCGL
jgi:hypothetical protein